MLRRTPQWAHQHRLFGISRKQLVWLVFNCAARRRPVAFLHQDLMQKSERTDDGWTVDDAPYFASEFDAARAMSVMTDESTFVLPFHGVEDFPPESAPLAVKSAQATSNGLIDPVMFGPNITGEFSASSYNTAGNQKGAFRVGAITDCPNKENNGGHMFYFDASSSNGVYGSSQTVQPASLRLILCIKS